MKKYRCIIFFSIMAGLLGCSAAGVVYTSDPYKKLNNAYALMNQGRPIPAERSAKEALASYAESNNKAGVAESHIFFGQLYKHKSYELFDTSARQINEESSRDKSIYHSQKAVDIYTDLGNYTQAAKAKFALANGYVKKDKATACRLYDESVMDFTKGKRLNTTEGFKFNPKFKSFESMVASFKQKFCSNKENSSPL